MGEHSLKDTFKFGYAECVRHVTQFLSSLKEVDSDLVSRITDHMTQSLASVSEEERQTPSASVTSTVPDTSTVNEDSRPATVEASEITDPIFVDPENSPHTILISKDISDKNKKVIIPSCKDRLPLLHCSSTPLTHVYRYRNSSSMTSVLKNNSNDDSGVSSYLDSSRVKPNTSSYLDSPRVEHGISSYLDSPRVKPSTSFHLDSPRFKPSTSSYPNSPCVEPNISFDLDSSRLQHDITNRQIVPSRFSVIKRASSSPMLLNDVWRPW
ncbi:uncharacterized protein LOC143250502 [Tachypleus tridentatus]|uniref:uncharacterized protein LOC143250502 n=1 Tax=Tachypleus tridentatus TaxID=6853 RepID=UPI003FD2EBAA